MIVLSRSKPRRVRVVVVDGDDRVLLAHRGRPGRARVWAPPAVPLDAGQDAVRAAAALLARIGLPGTDPGPVAWRRRVKVAAGGELEDHREELFLVRTEHRPAPGEDARWFALDELTAPHEPVYPRTLAALVSQGPGPGAAPTTIGP